jgi:hypothetical protein
MPDGAVERPDSGLVSTATSPFPSRRNMRWTAETPAYGKGYARQTRW